MCIIIKQLYYLLTILNYGYEHLKSLKSASSKLNDRFNYPLLCDVRQYWVFLRNGIWEDLVMGKLITKDTNMHITKTLMSKQ